MYNKIYNYIKENGQPLNVLASTYKNKYNGIYLQYRNAEYNVYDYVLEKIYLN